MAQILNAFSVSVTLGSTEISLGLQKLGMRALLVNFDSTVVPQLFMHVDLHVELMQVTGVGYRTW